MNVRTAVRRVLACGLLLAGSTLLAARPIASGQPQFAFSVFDVPGSINTEAWGINAAGDIVGIYQDTSKAVRGFLRHGKTITSVDYPQEPGGPAVFRTQAEGINPQGDIVGAYKLVGESTMSWHAFLLTRHGEFRNLDVPGWTGTLATGILPDGTIVGCVHSTNMTTTMQGFVRDPDGTVTLLPYPGTMVYGAPPDRRFLAGRYVDATVPPNQHYGFELDDAGIHYFRVPGSSFTQALGANARGEVVGYFFEDGHYGGFLKDGDDFTKIAHPGAVDTYIWGINPSGDIVGGSWNGTVEHGLVGLRTR